MVHSPHCEEKRLGFDFLLQKCHILRLTTESHCRTEFGYLWDGGRKSHLEEQRCHPFTTFRFAALLSSGTVRRASYSGSNNFFVFIRGLFDGLFTFPYTPYLGRDLRNWVCYSPNAKTNFFPPSHTALLVISAMPSHLVLFILELLLAFM